jgi:pimeloyl-ACP methyl ester carboxylesterase
MHVFYLHGFASAPQGGKAQLLAERFAPLGVTLHAPDLNEPAFETLTVTRMIEQVEAAMAVLPPGPVVLVGSSLGGFVAWHVAARAEADAAKRRVDRVVLLAPALTFDEASFEGLLGADGLRRWRETGRLELMHYGYGATRTLRYEIVADAARYASRAATVTVPVLIFQGRRDDLVDAAAVEAFAAGRPNVRLRLLDDDHRLHASLPVIWLETLAFLGLSAGFAAGLWARR